MRKALSGLTVIALVVAACSSTPSTEEATANLCSSIAGLESSVQSALALDLDSTVDEANAALDSVDQAWEDVKDDAKVVNEAATAEAEAALDSLKDSLNDASGGESLSQAATQAVAAIASFGAAITEITDSISCS